ncbi:MAG TPA: GNAT family protein [Thermomicrobiaceae bacterium]|nr:GNAT family protein [Thermomicrobiaceae bacterium]
MSSTAEAPVDEPIYNIRGEKVALGPIRRDLIPVYQRWINDLVTVRNIDMIPRPMSLEQETGWYESAIADRNGSLFTIYELSSGVPIGNTHIFDVDYYHRHATFGILIGEPSMRGKGYGTETTKLMLDYAFTVLGLNNVMLTVAAFNIGGIRAYQKAGFREIGRRRSSRNVAGQLWDTIYMDCLAEEFESPVLRRIFAIDEAAG